MQTIRQFVDKQAAAQPEAIYLVAPETGAVMSYRELRRASRELGRFLGGRGLVKGDKVALMLHNSYQTARLLIGVMYAGYTVAPLNLLAQRFQLAYVLEHSDAKLVFTSRDLEPRLREALAQLERPVTIETIDPDSEQIFDASTAANVGLSALAEDDDALLMYTSGTTGAP